ncbi:MAG: DsbA family protein [Alphaproteobacteria bacterium]|nr:DsbA family protein [Alphaproteobacteria bacterium]
MHFIRSFALTTSLVALSSAAFAQASAPVTKADIPALVKEAIMNDPEMIMQALEKLRAQKAEEAKKEAQAALEKNKAAIFNNPDLPASGASAKDADLTIAEFFDYHCGYCKHFVPELVKVMDGDKKLRVVFIDLPILSEDSATAARAAIAVNRIDKTKYFAFHTALMKETGKFDEAKLIEVVKKLGIKESALKTEMAKPEVTAILDKNRELAKDLGVNGTPGIIIGSEVIPGALSSDELKKYIATARQIQSGAAKK